jgi:SAM-dependent methyltransferase
MEIETRRLRLHDWLSLFAACAALLAIAACFAGRAASALAMAGIAVASAAMARRNTQRQPGPMPYTLRWVLFLPRWPLTSARLREILDPRPGEHMLEVGPGPGVFALRMAAALEPGGKLEALDVQSDMLADLVRRAGRAGVRNVFGARGDAEHLPYADARFDAVYLVSVLGEVPNRNAALREFRRVLKADGRLVVGESFLGDPDAIGFTDLCDEARKAGFALARRSGTRVAYFARFRIAV